MTESAFAYRAMVWMHKIGDLFHKPGKQLYTFGIQKGDTVVDYGCGPGRYVETAAALAGPAGHIFAADISPDGIEYVLKRIETDNLKNITPVLIEDNTSGIPDGCADVVYALDMFHLVNDPAPFLNEIHRVVKKGGTFYLEDGHQPREITVKKIKTSPLWKIAGEEEAYVILKPALK
jgi:ubiquinone/menaquinone biosynthesis C-methylase UbiE